MKSPSAMIDESGSLTISSIQPFSSTDKVIIKGSSLVKPLIVGGSFTNVESIQATKINIQGDGDIGGNMFIGGSLDVHGSVVGSGPYMDSSDLRYKSNISSIKNALTKVIALKGVSILFVHL
jgi:ABC-type phosphate transport system substrate-binding protein